LVNQGKGTPSNVNPNLIAKETKLKINWSQRTPREAKAIKDNPERYEVLKDILADPLLLCHDNVSLIFSFNCLSVFPTDTSF
jgi:hypothetical protein